MAGIHELGTLASNLLPIPGAGSATQGRKYPMKFATKHIAAAVLMATMGLTAATAQTPPPAGAPERHHGHKFDPAKMQERMAQRQTELKQKLQLTAAQEGAWTTFTNAMKPTARPQRPDREAIARLSTPDRIDQMRALRNQRIAEMDRRGEATKAFYAVLTPAQKQVFDAETLHRGHGGHGGRHHKG